MKVIEIVANLVVIVLALCVCALMVYGTRALIGWLL